jgi:hypothetical protein
VTTSAPLIIGATGGSGTRVVARIAQKAGYNLGIYINESNDALAFRAFNDCWINRFLESQGGRTRPGVETEQMTNAFRIALAHHLDGIGPQATFWGWKAPRSIYLLPFFHTQFPRLKFIHLLRDGRDMAVSKNQNQLHKHGAQVLSWRERYFKSEPLRSILLWAKVNLRAAEFGDTNLRENYLAVRFEDLCGAPVETTTRILRFLNVDLEAEPIARTEIAVPSSIGRWRKQPSRFISKMTAAARPALEKFGYLN